MRNMFLMITLCISWITSQPLFAQEETQGQEATMANESTPPTPTWNANSSILEVCQKNLDQHPIQQQGRVKPFYVHAYEVLQILTGKGKPLSLGTSETYCLLSLSFLNIGTIPNLDLRVDHIKIQQLLALPEGKKTISYKESLAFMKELRMAWVQEKVENPYKKALSQIMNQIGLYQSVVEGLDWTISPLPLLASEPDINKAMERPWPSLKDFLSMNSDLTQSPQNLHQALEQLSLGYTEKMGDKHILELNYSKARLPIIVMALTGLALLALTLTDRVWPGLTLAVLTLVVQTTLIALRVIISGRAPITNMYETVLFSGYAALIMALIIGHFRQDKTFIFVGLMYNFLCCLMLNFAHGMVSATIGPLVPVLRDNFWLSTHVTSVIMSYGAFALSWILANMILFQHRLGRSGTQSNMDKNDAVYTCLKVGVVLLAGGIILGGVWADYSWGRFWGWDPKETWSLIALCIYMIILHGKFTNWISPERFIPAVSLAFSFVMMAWFGVNYILAAGLHSYGFSQGGAIFLGTFFTAQILFLLWSGPSYLKKKGA